MNIQETVDYHLRSTLFSTRRLYNILALDNGITQGIGYALINISKEGVPATKIAPIMGMSTSSLSRLLKNMEDDGLIYRKANEEDRRVVKIFLTPMGLELRACFSLLKKQINILHYSFYGREMSTGSTGSARITRKAARRR